MIDNTTGALVLVWFLSAIAIVLIDQRKGRAGGSGIILALILGPIGVLLALLEPAEKPKSE